MEMHTSQRFTAGITQLSASSISHLLHVCFSVFILFLFLLSSPPPRPPQPLLCSHQSLTRSSSAAALVLLLSKSIFGRSPDSTPTMLTQTASLVLRQTFLPFNIYHRHAGRHRLHQPNGNPYNKIQHYLPKNTFSSRGVAVKMLVWCFSCLMNCVCTNEDNYVHIPNAFWVTFSTYFHTVKQYYCLTPLSSPSVERFWQSWVTGIITFWKKG